MNVDQLPAFLAVVIGSPLRYTLVLLLAYVLILNIKQSLLTALKWYEDRDL